MSRSPQALRAAAVLFAALFALPAAAQGRTPTACNEENASCREDCTMDFGTSQRTQSQLLKCIDGCRTTHQRCTERWNELREANIDPEPPSSRAQQVGDVYISEEQPVPGAAVAEESPPPRTDGSGRTRYATEEDAAPRSDRSERRESGEPLMRVEKENYNEGISLPPDEPGTEPPQQPRERTERTERPRAERKSEPAPSSDKPSTDKKPRKSHPDLPPEPENDISDWDPDGR